MCLKLIKIESLNVFLTHFDYQLKSNFLCIFDDYFCLKFQFIRYINRLIDINVHVPFLLMLNGKKLTKSLNNLEGSGNEFHKTHP